MSTPARPAASAAPHRSVPRRSALSRLLDRWSSVVRAAHRAGVPF